MYQPLMPLDAPTEPEETRYQCRHVFTDGHRCGSPCLKNEDFCYFHHTSRRPIQDPAKRRRRQTRFAVRMPEDRTAIQLTLGEVLQKLANNELDPRRAGLLLYGLQIASLNLPRLPKADPKARPEEPVDEITLDPKHGAIALPEEYIGPQQKKGSAQLLLEELARMDLQERNPTPSADEDVWRDDDEVLPTVQAVAPPTLSFRPERGSPDVSFLSERHSSNLSFRPERHSSTLSFRPERHSSTLSFRPARSGVEKPLYFPGHQTLLARTHTHGSTSNPCPMKILRNKCRGGCARAMAHEKITLMSDLPTPAPARKTGLSPKEQKLQALREKAAHATSGAKPLPGASAAGFKAKSSFTGKKTAFQRKAT